MLALQLVFALGNLPHSVHRVSLQPIISYFKLIFNDNNYNDDIRTIFMVLSLQFIFTLSHIVNFTRHQGGLRSFDPTVRSACGLSVYPLVIAISPITQPKADIHSVVPRRVEGWDDLPAQCSHTVTYSYSVANRARRGRLTLIQTNQRITVKTHHQPIQFVQGS